MSLLNKVEERFEQESNLIELQSGRVIFVGDTHGDIDATQKIIDKYLKSGNTIVFLGDYVDRGPQSEDNLNLLLQTKLDHPDDLYLLMGNHEGYRAMQFLPADYWQRLDSEEYDRYGQVLSRLPLVVSTSNGIIALHGALPDVETLQDINTIEFGSLQWQQITWGDWQESDGGYLNSGHFTGRPQFGRDWFRDIMNRLEKKILIRSHQPTARTGMYERKCLTIFTSSSYHSGSSGRTIAITDISDELSTIDDLLLETI